MDHFPFSYQEEDIEDQGVILHFLHMLVLQDRPVVTEETSIVQHHLIKTSHEILKKDEKKFMICYVF